MKAMGSFVVYAIQWLTCVPLSTTILVKFERGTLIPRSGQTWGVSNIVPLDSQLMSKFDIKESVVSGGMKSSVEATHMPDAGRTGDPTETLEMDWSLSASQSTA